MLMLSYGTLNNLVVLWSCAMVVSCQRSQFSIWFRRPSPMCGCSTEFFLSHDDQFFRDLYLYLCYLLIVAFRKKSKLIRVLNPKKGAINSVPSLSHPNLWPWILPMPLTPVTLRLVIDKYVKFHACQYTIWMPMHCRFGQWKLKVGKIVRFPTEIHDGSGVCEMSRVFVIC